MLLGTWNLENLYRPGSPYGPKDKSAYEAKLAALASVIGALDPALLGVQEVGDPGALEDLAGLLGVSWRVALSAHPDGRGIRVGFLARTELTVVSDTAALPARLDPVQTDDSGGTATGAGRGFLAVTVQTAAGPLTAAVAHLKSKLLTYPGDRFYPHDEGERARYGAYALFRRTAEAAALRALADELLAGQGKSRDVTVLGDLNDEVQAATTQILLGRPAPNSAPPATTTPTRATPYGCGTRPRGSRPSSATPASTPAATSSSITSSSATTWSTA